VVRWWCGGHQAELAEGFVGVEPHMFHDVADAQTVNPCLVEVRPVLRALVASSLPGPAASQHLRRQRDGDLARNLRSGSHAQFSRTERQLSRAAMPYPATIITDDQP
jgi:hypothetical protein